MPAGPGWVVWGLQRTPPLRRGCACGKTVAKDGTRPVLPRTAPAHASTWDSSTRKTHKYNDTKSPEAPPPPPIPLLSRIETAGRTRHGQRPWVSDGDTAPARLCSMCPSVMCTGRICRLLASVRWQKKVEFALLVVKRVLEGPNLITYRGSTCERTPAWYQSNVRCVGACF